MITLAAMLAVDRDALACDLWETYQVTDMEALPIKTLAMLSCGLRENSRIKLLMAQQKHNTETLMLALCFDALSSISFALTGGDNPPKSVYKALMGIIDEDSDEIVSYESAEEWEAEKKRILGGA